MLWPFIGLWTLDLEESSLFLPAKYREALSSLQRRNLPSNPLPLHTLPWNLPFDPSALSLPPGQLHSRHCRSNFPPAFPLRISQPLRASPHLQVLEFLGSLCGSFLLLYAVSDQLCVLMSFSHVWLFASPWTVVHQAPLWDSPGNNTGVGCHALLQEIFPTQGSNPGLPHSRQNPLNCQIFNIHELQVPDFILRSSAPTLSLTYSVTSPRDNLLSITVS